MRAILLLVLVCVAGFAFVRYSAPRTYPPGVLVNSEPVQKPLSGIEPAAQRAGFTITPLARFSVDARVLHRRNYGPGDPVAKLSPVDLALGWGPMSDQAVLDRLQIKQSMRFYFWRWEGQPPIPESEIISHSSNMHLVPSSDAMQSRLQSVRTGDLIRLSGLLIEVSKPGEAPWRSSLSRTDTGRGACEIVWVESLERL
jgi:hypothetical protein